MSVKISELPLLDSLADNDIIAGVDTSADVTSKIEMSTLKDYIGSNTYTAGTNIDITNDVISAPNVYNKTEVDDLIEAIDTVGALKKNIEHIMIEQDKQQEIINTMQIGDVAINSDLGIKNEQDYLKSLLGSGGTNGGPTSY